VEFEMSGQSDNPENRPSWRQGAGNPGSQPPNEQVSWRRTDIARSSGQPFWKEPRWQRIGKVVASVGSLLLSAALIIYLTMLPGCTRTELIVVSVTQFDDCRIPDRPFAQHDAEALLNLKSTLRGKVSSENLQNNNDFKTQLERADRYGLLIVYLASHGGFFLEGGAGSDQSAGLFWQDSQLDELRDNQPRGFYRFTQFLADLKQLNRHQPTLLLLDLNSDDADWRLGMLGNWSMDDLHDQVKSVPGLTVITSCSPGERSWSGNFLGADSQGQSAFAHFITERLRSEDKSLKRQISITELFEYVHDRTNSWVWKNRDATNGQHPLMLSSSGKEDRAPRIGMSGKRRDVSTETATDEPGSSATAVWRDLEQAWQERQKRAGRIDNVTRPDAAYQFDPIRWRALTHNLLRAEESRRARSAGPARQVVDQAKKLLTELDASIRSDVLQTTEPQPFVSNNVIPRVQLLSPISSSSADVPALPEEHVKKASAVSLASFSSEAAIAPKLRALAENAASGPLGTHFLVGKLVREADTQRRDAEDRLFIDGKAEAIQKAQESATQTYERVRSIQRVYYQTVCLRNRLLAELPELAIWAADRAQLVKSPQREAIFALFRRSLGSDPARLPNVKQLNELDYREKDLESLNIDLLVLFQLNREFEEQLATWTAEALPSDESLKTGQANFQEAQKRLQHLESSIRQVADELLREHVEQPQALNWRRVNDLLGCPVLDPEQRAKLNQILIDYSKGLEEQFSANQKEESGRAPDQPSPDARPANARWNGLWAIQALARGSVISQAESIKPWRQWSELLGEDDVQFRSKITNLGDLIRKAFIANQDALEYELTQMEQPEQTAEFEADPGKVLGRKIIADRAARAYVDHCAANSFASKPNPAFNPAAALRKHQMHSLLLFLSERYLEDYWNGWYDKAAEQCLIAAGNERFAVPVLNKERYRLAAILQQRKRAQFDIAAEALSFDSSTSKSLSVKIGYTGLPVGTAAAWLELPSKSGVMHRDGLRLPGSQRQPAQLLNSSDLQSTVLKFELERDEGSDSKLTPFSATSKLLFRGHQREKEIQIDPTRPVGIRLANAASEKTGKVMVDGFHEPVVLFILDCSGSMTILSEPGKNRFAVAKEVLERALNQMVNQTAANSVQVGIMTYGDAPNNSHTVRTLSPIAPLNAGRIPQIQAQLNSLKLDVGSTPLLNAVKTGCEMLQGTGGMIIAITDGIYTDNTVTFEKVKEQVDNAHRDNGVELTLIAMQLDVTKLTQQENRAYQNMTKLPRLRSQYVPAGNSKELFKAITSASEILPYTVVPLSNGPRPKATALGKTVDLPPGAYEARFGTTTPIRFQIAGGELIKLQAGANRMSHLKAAIQGLAVPTSEPDLKLGYQSFSVDDKNSNAHFVLSLTNSDDNKTVNRPEEIDFEMTPEVDSTIRSQTVSIEPEQSVPTWHVAVADWPQQMPADVQVTGKMKRTPPDLAPFAWPDLQELKQRRGKITLNSSAFDKLDLTLLKADFNAEQRTATIEIQFADYAENPKQLNRQQMDEIRKIRFEMRLKANRQTPVNCTTSREFFEKDAKLVVKIELHDVKMIDDWEVTITSWKSLQEGAFRLKNPWRIQKIDFEK
jgi:hypothetical protein